MDLKEGQVLVFRHNKTGDNQPDWDGYALIKGVNYKIALWEKTSAKGKNYMGGKIEPDNEPAQPPPSNVNYERDKPVFREQPPAQQPEKEEVDDLPF